MAARGERPSWRWSTAPRPGAIAVAHLVADPAALDDVLEALCGTRAPGVGTAPWRRLAAIDDGVVARVLPGHALVMPHGGPRIRAALDAWMADRGISCADPGAVCFPEAKDEVERRALMAMACAASPAAIDLLADQSRRWREAGGDDAWRAAGSRRSEQDRARDRRLMRLVVPARVVVTGPANAGKSTLLNALAGRTVAIAHATAGTTRDAVAARIDLAGVVVDVFDTPGVRPGMDEVERAAARLAERALAAADLVVEMTAPGLGWAALAVPHGAGRIRVLNQCDRPEAAACVERADTAHAIGARDGIGLDALATALREALVPRADLHDPRPWHFA